MQEYNKTKRKFLAVMLSLIMITFLMPTTIFADTGGSWPAEPGKTAIIDGISYSYGGDASATSTYLNEKNENSWYKAGNGYILWNPGENGGTALLHNAVIDASSSGDAAIKVPDNTTVILQGENSITHNTRGIYADKGHLVVEGPGKLNTFKGKGLSAYTITINKNATVDASYNNGTSGINSGGGDVVIEDSTVTVKSNGTGAGIGSGAIFANDQDGIQPLEANIHITNSKVIAIDTTGKALNAGFGEVLLKDSNVVAIGKDDGLGAIYTYYSNGKYLTVDGGSLYVQNTGAGYDITYTGKDSAINGAEIYCGGNSTLFPNEGKNAQFANCTYDQDADKITSVGGGQLSGDWTYSDDMPRPDTAMLRVKNNGSSLSIPAGTAANISVPLRIDVGTTLKVDGTLNTDNGLILYGSKAGTGAINGVILTYDSQKKNYTYTVSNSGKYSSFINVGIVKETKNVFENPAGATFIIHSGQTMDLTKNSITSDNLEQYFKNSGNLDIEGTILFPEGTAESQLEGMHIYSSDINTGLIKIGSKKYIAAPDGVTWSSSSKGTALWKHVPGSKEYAVQLYKDGKLSGLEITVSTNTCDFSESINKAGDGKYTFTVKAVGQDGTSTLTGKKATSSSLNIGSAAGGSGAAIDNVTNNTADNTTTADISSSVTVTDNKAEGTVDQATADKIVDKAVSNNSDTVIIDVTTQTGITTAAQIKIPQKAISDIVEKTNADITIKTDTGEVKFDKTAAKAVADKSKNGTATIIIEKIKEDENEVQLQLKVVSEEGVITDFNGGTVEIIINLSDKIKNKNLVCVFVDDNGIFHRVTGKKNNNGTYTFKTKHFSYYKIMEVKECEQIFNNQTAAGVKATAIAVKSTAGKGNIKVTWTKSKGYKVDGYRVYKAVKKTGTYKKVFDTKMQSYKNTKVKKGIKYYYKVRGYRIINGKIIYTKYSNITYKTAK